MSSENETINAGKVKLRDLGNSSGFTVPVDALRDLELVDSEDELLDILEEVEVPYEITDDGKIEYDVPLEEVKKLQSDKPIP